MERLVVEFINFINDLVNDEFDYCIDYVDSKYYFMHGGCLEFAKVLHHYLKNSYIVIRDDFEHFAVEYEGNIYDTGGMVSEKGLYYRLSHDDLLKVEHRYGILELKFGNEKVHSIMIKEVDCCSGEYVKRLLHKINEV